MSDIVIADQEYAKVMKILGNDLLALRKICYEHASILRSVANYAGFCSAEFSLSIDTYVPQVQAIGDAAVDAAERILEQTSTFIQNVDAADQFLY